MSVEPAQETRQPISWGGFFWRTLVVALIAASGIVALTALMIEARERALDEFSGKFPKQLNPSFIVTVSPDDRLQVSTAGHDIVIQDRETEEDKFGISLALHPIHGRLCRGNYLASRDDPTGFQQWNPIESRWQPVGEGLLLKTIHATKPVFVLVFVCFVVAYVVWDFGFVPGWMPSIMTVLGVTLLVLAALRLSPTGSRAHSIVVATFSSDASRLATCSQHGSDLAVCIWDTSTGRGLATYDLRDLPPDALEFSPDDRVIIAFRDGVQVASWEVE